MGVRNHCATARCGVFLRKASSLVFWWLSGFQQIMTLGTADSRCKASLRWPWHPRRLFRGSVLDPGAQPAEEDVHLVQVADGELVGVQARGAELAERGDTVLGGEVSAGTDEAQALVRVVKGGRVIVGVVGGRVRGV